MNKTIIIDAAHREETRIAVLDDGILQDFDREAISIKQIKGNIYYAKVTRVEASLQSAFVDYGSDRHGFLPFSDIHPDYYQIPESERQKLRELNLNSENSQNKTDDEEENHPIKTTSEKGEKDEIAIMHIIQKYIIESKKILFEGDGYSEEWAKQAEKRGLPNVKTTPLALDAMVFDSSKKLFENNNVYNHAELEARHEIELEKYIKKVQIEARIMGDLALSHIIPAAVSYQTKLAANVKGLKDAGLPATAYASQVSILTELSEHIQTIYSKVDAMTEARKDANNLTDTRAKAIAYCDTIKEAFFDDIRYSADKLELLVNDNAWPLPKYRELLFLRQFLV